MTPHPDIERMSKEAGAIEVEKINALDIGNVKRDVDRTLTADEKKVLKRAT